MARISLRSLLVRLAPLGLAMCLAAGCASSRYRASLVVPEGYRAEVVVIGDHPQVHLDNEGPGQLRAEIHAPGRSPDVREIASGSVSLSSPGPIQIVVTEVGRGDTVVRIEAHGSGGLRLHGAVPNAPRE